jgi:thioredoxin 1
MLKTLEDFENQIIKSTGPVVLKFWAKWCGPCNMLAPVMEKVADANSNVPIYEADVDKNTPLTTKLNISGIPAVLFFKDGKEVSRIVGLQQQKDYQNKIDELTNSQN